MKYISNFYATPKLPGYLRWWLHRYPRQITQESHRKYTISIGKKLAVVAKRVTRVTPTTRPVLPGQKKRPVQPGKKRLIRCAV